MRLTSCQAENSEPVARAIAGYLSRKLAMPFRYVDDIDWQERYRRLDKGTIEIGWICGLPYVRKMDSGRSELELLAAPVMKGARYGGEPVYYSDVVVRSDSPYQTFADLEGASWAINEPNSQSGCGITRHHLAILGRDWSFFGRLIESGAHRISLDMILNGSIQASAIDSTYLEWRLRRQPELRTQIRLIAALGPSPMPPWIVSSRVTTRLRAALRTLLLDMAQDTEGQAILDIGDIARFAVVTDQSYDPIRLMLSGQQ